MLILGSTDEDYQGLREVTAPPAPDNGWMLTEDTSGSDAGLVVHRVEDLDAASSLVDGAERPLGIVTGVGRFPTMGDLAALDGPVIPVLDWASVGGIPTTVEGCRAVIGFIRESFEPERIDPIRTRMTTDHRPAEKGMKRYRPITKTVR